MVYGANSSSSLPVFLCGNYNPASTWIRSCRRVKGYGKPRYPAGALYKLRFIYPTELGIKINRLIDRAIFWHEELACGLRNTGISGGKTI